VNFQRRRLSRVYIKASRVIRAGVLACVAMVGVSASAASFDCAKAKSDMEITVCTSPELSVLDEQLVNTYAHAKGALSVDGRAMLTNVQRDWLRFVNDATDEDVCLGNELRRRVSQLGSIGLHVDGHVLTRMDLYDAIPAKTYPYTVGFPGFVVRHVGYPQIDAAPSGEMSAWNSRQVKALPDLNADNDDQTDEDIDYAVGCAGGKLLGIRVETSEYNHGAPHPDWSVQTNTTVFTPEVRDMTPEDLFASNAAWEDKLPDLFWQAYLHGEHVIKDRPEIEPAVREAAIDTGKWLLTPEGLQISFDAYEAGCYVCNPGPLTVPWMTLKPLLASKDMVVCPMPKKAD